MGFFHQFIQRNQRLILTLISKQWLVFFIGTLLLVRGYVTDQVWVMLAGVVLGLNTFQKFKGVPDVGNAAVAK